MSDDAARALLAAAELVHVAASAEDGTPILHAVQATLRGDWLVFRAVPLGERALPLGARAVASAEQVVARVPDDFPIASGPSRGMTLHRAAQAHGTIELVDGETTALGAHRSGLEAGLAAIHGDPHHVLGLRIERLDGRRELLAHGSPAERVQLLEALWRRGAAGDVAAIDAILDAAPDTPRPAFLDAPDGVRLRFALEARHADAVADLLAGEYWNDLFDRETLARAHLASPAWVGALDAEGRVVGSARAISDGAKHAWIYDVVVAERHRGRGIGRALVCSILDHPAVRRARFVHLGTRDRQRFYAALGFRDVSELPPRPYRATSMVLDRGTTAARS